MVNELSGEDKKKLFEKLDKVIENHKHAKINSNENISLDKSNENLDATDDYYFNENNKSKKKIFKHNFNFDFNSNKFFKRIVENFDKISFLQSIAYAFFITIIYLLLTFIFFKFVLVKSTIETFNMWVSIFWIALLAFDLPLFPVILSSFWAMAKPKKMGLIYSMSNSVIYFILIFSVFLVFGLTKNSLFEGPGIFFIILIFITCLIRGFLGFILGEWYKNRLDNSKKK